MEKKGEKNFFEDALKKVSYSTGFTWKKAHKLKNKTMELLQNMKVSAIDMIEFFKTGYGHEPKEEKIEEAGLRASTAIKDTPQTVLNADFEREIEDITKEAEQV